jgi:hypothetical protein
MMRTRIERAATIAAFAIVGWAVCAAAIGIGFGLMSERGALILHAIVAPIAFAGLSWLYFARCAYTRPLTTALLFLAVVVALDVFVVALLIEKSFAMFASPLGTWAPLFLIFASTWTAGALVERTRRRSRSRSGEGGLVERRFGHGKALRSPGGGTAIPRR